MSQSGIVVGVLDAPATGVVGPTGRVELPHSGITLDWSSYTDEWRAPSATTARQQALGGMPVVETRVAVRGGDIVHRVYAVNGPPAALVVEFENASAEPIGVALRVAGVPVDVVPNLVRAAPPWREVHDDGAQGGDGTALVWPLPHRATVRAVVPLAGHDAGTIDPRRQPSADEVQRGWAALLDRGARLDVDDDVLQRAVDGSRAAMLLLAGRDDPRPVADDVVALEGWGFDREALAVWQRLSLRERRRAGRRRPLAEPWPAVRAALARTPGGVPESPAAFLRAIQDVVLAETGRDGRTIALWPHFPAEWLGRAVAIHDAPTRQGPVSCAVRWHGARPALLWNAPKGVTVTAPALDPSWSTTEPEGEALLASPSDQLLRLSTAPREGDPVEEPGSFT